MTHTTLAIDIGGTKTAIGLVDDDLRVIDTASGATPARKGPDAVFAQVAAITEQLLARHPHLAVEAIGLAAAGVVDTGSQTIISSTDTFADWPGTNIAERTRQALARWVPETVPVHAQNDVDAHAYGEFLAGAAAGSRSALVVAVGTGVGGAAVLDGQVRRGAHHVAGEIAHIPTPGAEHLRCPCGRFGHLEAIGSGVGLYQHYLSLGGTTAAEDARGVVALAVGGDARAAEALTASATAVGRALAGLVTFIDPDCVVITGGVADIGDLWWQPVRRAFAAEVIDALAGVRLVPGTLGGHAPLVGAAASAREALGKDNHA